MADQTVEPTPADQADNTLPAQDANADLAPLVSLAAALLDPDRLRVAGILAAGPANRMELAEATGLSHRDLLRQLDILRQFEVVKLEEPAPRNPDPYTRYELNHDTLRTARQAMGKYKGVKPRPTDAREMTLATFMPDGKLNSLPRKQEQLLTVLGEIALKFNPDKQYSEREVNVILEDINEDYCTVRRSLVDYGYLSRTSGIYTRNL